MKNLDFISIGVSALFIILYVGIVILLTSGAINVCFYVDTECATCIDNMFLQVTAFVVLEILVVFGIGGVLAMLYSQIMD